MEKKGKKKVFLILMLFFGFVLLITYQLIQQPSIKKISERIKIQIPQNAKLLFYKKTNSLTSEVTYLKFRIDRNAYSNFIKNEIFSDAKEGSKGMNAFSSLKIRYEKWNPQDVEESVSGRIVHDAENIISATYLFDIKNDSWVDCYFAIYLE